MLVARPGVEVVRPHIVRLSRASWDAAEALVAELEAAAVAQLSEFATVGEDLSVVLTLEMRYAGQGHEIAVPTERTWIRRGDDAAVMAAFEREYVRRFGRSLERVPIEIVAWRLRASTTAAVATTGVDRREARDDSRPHVAERSVFFRATERFEPCRVLQRSELSPQMIAGPCLIEDSNTTIMVPRGWSVSRTAEGGDVVAQRAGA
jgi:N-methylhydantoinase A